MSDAALDPASARPREPTVSPVLGADGRPIDWVKVFLGFGGLTLGNFMAILDIQIVASSLVEIQAGIGATADEISWLQTIYLLAEVVSMPLTAYLTKMWGTRPFVLGACAGFMIASVVVGLSSSVGMMIAARAIQGFCAGAMIPPVFAVAMTVFPPERRISANVFLGLVVTMAPTIGPTLGGHLTEALGWRWLFFINVPVGFVVLFLVGRYANFDRGDPSLKQGVDWWGLGLMTVFLLSMQYVFEEGSREGWFADPLILWLTVLAVLTGVSFLWRELAYRQPIVSLRPFADRNFAIGIFMTFMMGMALFGGTFVLPLFMGQVSGYSSAQIGTTMMVSGLTVFVSGPIAGRLARTVDMRLLVVFGLAIAGWAVHLGAKATAEWGFNELMVMQIARSVGVMLAMTASQQLAISNLPVSQMKDASGLINLMRNVGGAIGLALLTTLITHQNAVHYSELAAAANIANPYTAAMMDGITAMVAEGGAADPESVARKAMGMMLHRQANVLSFADAFAALAVACWLTAGFAFFARAPNKIHAQAEEGH